MVGILLFKLGMLRVKIDIYIYITIYFLKKININFKAPEVWPFCYAFSNSF